MRRYVIAMVVATGLLVGMASAASGARFTKKQACDLVKESDIEAAFFSDPSQTTGDGKKGKFTTCTWLLTPDGGRATVFVGIDKTNKLNKADFKEKSKAATSEKVSGIKKGFYDGETGGTVTFIKGANFVNVQYLGATPADAAGAKDSVIGLAKVLYKRLKS
jgi:hypothetical protein